MHRRARALTTSTGGLLTGRHAVVTGGASGLGAATVASLAEHGATGVVLDLAEAIDRAPGRDGWTARPADVTRVDDLRSVFSAIANDRTIDIVVAVAGIAPPWTSTADTDFDHWDSAFAVNARGVMATLSAAAPHLASPGGSFVAVASVNAWKAHAQQAAYTASKHAVTGIVKAAALDLGAAGIRVNAVAPGPVLTDALSGRIRDRAAAGGPTYEAAIDAMCAETALGRLAEPDDVARAIVFLASDLSSAITGHLLPVDSGIL